MYDITASIVLYKNQPALVEKTIASFLKTKLEVQLYLVDHSPTDDLKILSNDLRLAYFWIPKNPGFGAGHNFAIRKTAGKTNFHVIINPDIYYKEPVIESILRLMNQDPTIGVVMPKVLYPDGEIQHLAKLLPSPFDFIVRRLIPVKQIRKKIGIRFELRNSGYNQTINAPFLSGCFLVFNMEAILKIRLFDEQIFMYTEDIDICRRMIIAGYKCIFFPKVFVYHDHQKKSFTNFKTFKIYLKSAIYYFNKWGWFCDPTRKKINQHTLNQF